MFSRVWSTWTRLSFRTKLVVSGSFLSGCCAYAYLVFRPASPEEICRQAVYALERRDAASLIRLAEPDELSKLNLNSQTLNGFLMDTLGPAGFRGPHKCSIAHHRASDSVDFEVTRPENGNAWAVRVNVLGEPDGSWKLNLSMLMYYLCFSQSSDVEKARTTWSSLKTKYGIPGRRHADGSYTFCGPDHGPGT